MQLQDTVVLALCIVSYVRANRALAPLQAISVADNKLTDASLPFLAKALATMPNLTKVDISDNLVSHTAPCSEKCRLFWSMWSDWLVPCPQVGKKAAAAFNELFSNHCKNLRELIMARADLDDDEINQFVQAVSRNTDVQILDISKNKIGAFGLGSQTASQSAANSRKLEEEGLSSCVMMWTRVSGMLETRNTVEPDFITGGEALAEALRSSDCKLRKLVGPPKIKILTPCFVMWSGGGSRADAVVELPPARKCCRSRPFAAGEHVSRGAAPPVQLHRRCRRGGHRCVGQERPALPLMLVLRLTPWGPMP
jgi:hypothetical protein